MVFFWFYNDQLLENKNNYTKHISKFKFNRKYLDDESLNTDFGVFLEL